MLDRLILKARGKLLCRGKTIAVAESCSGGLLCAGLTRQAGASGYFLLGVITYSNKSKQKLLGVPAKLISGYGAVSRQVAVSMAENIRKISGADLGLGITGIAGPDGAGAGKPIGTVFISLSIGKINFCRKYSFKGSRDKIRNRAVEEALRLLCAHL